MKNKNMNENTRTKLNQFTCLDTWSSNHRSDDRRFYDFIIEAYKNKDYGISSDEFLSVFGRLNEGLTEIAEKRYRHYTKGIELIRHLNGNL